MSKFTKARSQKKTSFKASTAPERDDLFDELDIEFSNMITLPLIQISGSKLETSLNGSCSQTLINLQSSTSNSMSLQASVRALQDEAVELQRIAELREADEQRDKDAAQLLKKAGKKKFVSGQAKTNLSKFRNNNY